MELQCVTLLGPETEKALDDNHRNLNKDTWKFYILRFQVLGGSVHLKFFLIITAIFLRAGKTKVG